MRSTSFWTLRSSRCWGRYCWFVGWFVIPTVCHRPGLPDHLLGRYTGAEQFARNLLCDVGTPVTSLEASTTNNCGRLTTCTMEEADVVEEAITPTIRSMSVIAILGHLRQDLRDGSHSLFSVFVGVVNASINFSYRLLHQLCCIGPVTTLVVFGRSKFLLGLLQMPQSSLHVRLPLLGLNFRL